MEASTQLSDLSLQALVDFLGDYAECLPTPRQQKIAAALEVLMELLKELEVSRAEC